MFKNKRIVITLLIFFSTVSWVTARSLPDFVDIVKSEKAKVIHISTSTKTTESQVPKQFFDFFPNLPNTPIERNKKALGSGFFYSKDGYIVTNNHVVKGADKIEILLDNNEIFPAEVIGNDERTDLALLKIDAKRDFSPMKWGDSDNVKVGEWVIAIGNPFGFDQTVTAGIISAKDRDVLGGTAYGSFLQTDAAINSGNSGGPLLNQEGEVIGINTAIAGGVGLGFAIPSNLAQNIIKQLLEYGNVIRGWLGVGINELDNELVQTLDLEPTQRGVLVVKIYPDSPAEKADFKKNDIIIEVNKNKITTSTELQQIIAETPPGKNIEIKILRDNKVIKKKVKIIKFEEEFAKVQQSSSESSIGLGLITIDQSIKNQFQLTVDKGLLITKVDSNSPIAGQVNAGDVILKLNNKSVDTINKFNEEINKLKENATFSMLINRNGTQLLISGRINNND